MKNIITTLVCLVASVAYAQFKPTRYDINTDAVAGTLTTMIRDRGSNTQLTLKFFGTNGNNASYGRAFLDFANTNAQQTGFHIMTSQETSDGTMMILMDSDRDNPSSLLNITNFNTLFASIADSMIIGTPPGFLTSGGIGVVDSSIIGIANLENATTIADVDITGFSTLGSATNALRTIAHGRGIGTGLDFTSDDVFIGDTVMALAFGKSVGNVVIGSQSGSFTDEAVSNSIVIGYDCDPQVNPGGNQLNILGTVFGTGMPFRPHQSVGSGKVGINIKAPSQTLDVLGNVRAANGFITVSNAAVAPASITFPSSTVPWTNTFGINIALYIENSGVTGSAISKNGQQIFSSLVGDTTLLFKPGDYFSETYTLGTPTARWEPR